MSGAALVLFGGETPDAPLAWMQVRRSDLAIVGCGELQAGGQAPDGAGEAVLVLRASEAQLRSLDLPAKTEAQARGAAAFAFENELAVEAGATFCAIGPVTGPGQHRLVAALDRTRLQSWIARCRAAGATPKSVFLDATLLSVAAGEVRIVSRDDAALLAGGPAGGFSIEAPLAPALARAWLQRQGEARPQVVVEGAALEPVAAALQSEGYAVQRRQAGDVEAELARAALSPPAFAPQLRQGEFAPAARSRAGGRVWATTVGLALAAAALQIGILVFDGFRDQKTAAEITAKVEHDFRELRPDVKRIVNLRAQLSAALNAARRPARNPAIAASYPVVGVLKTHPDVRLEEVRHDAPGRRVSMRFSGAQPGLLEAVIADLRKGDPRIEVEQMRAVEGRSSVLVTLVAP